MNETVKNELDRIVTILAGTGIVTKIILFGSYARGDETLNSDIDLCVLTSVRDKRPIELMKDFNRKIWNAYKTSLDLLAYNQDNFYYYAEDPTSLEREIAEKGVLLYEHR